MDINSILWDKYNVNTLDLEGLDFATHEPQIPEIVRVPKDDGSNDLRELVVFNELDRAVLRIINEDIVTKNEVNNNVHSYRRGHSIVTAIQHIVRDDRFKNEHVIKTDISKYFDSVDKDTIFKLLDSIDTTDEFRALLKRYYSIDQVIDNGEVVIKKLGLMQGTAVGATLSNLLIKDVDDELSEVCTYVRYSDDILLISNSKEHVHNTLEFLKSLLKDYNLKLNRNKTAYYPPHGTIYKYLGYKIMRTDRVKILIMPEKILKWKRDIKKLTRKRKDFLTLYIKKYLLTDYPKYVQWFTLVDIKSIIELDNYFKLAVSKSMTGKWRMNKNKIKSIEHLDISPFQLYNLYKQDSSLLKIVGQSAIAKLERSEDVERQ